MKLLLSIAASLVLLAAIDSCAHAQANAPADLIVHNGQVLTVDAKFSTAEAVAIRDGKIVAVGKNADVLKRKGEKTRVIDAHGWSPPCPGLLTAPTLPGTR